MMTSLINHLWIIGTVVFIVYSQCVIRWRLSFAPILPEGFLSKLPFLLSFLMDPWVISAIVATFLSGLMWIVSLTKFELSYAYPWMASVFLLMFFAAIIFFDEAMSISKLVGTVIIVAGLILIVKG